jgi:CP family cyanate transporter-like MFS transporter
MEGPIRLERRWLLAFGVLLIAANLRPAVTSVGPVLPEIGAEYRLSGVALALLAAAPLICFGVLAPLAPVLAARLGVDRTLGLVVAAILLGLVIRVGPGSALLFGGTVLIGGAIAIGNVLLPALLKREFGRPGLMTGLYATVLGLTGSVAAGATVPLAAALGGHWRVGLAFWAIPATVALLVWLPLSRRRTVAAADIPSSSLVRALRDRVAWQLAIFSGLHSLCFYTIVAWLPSILRDHGLSPTDAGLLLGLTSIVGLPVGLLIPTWTSRQRDQRLAVVLVTALTGIGLLGLLAAPPASAVLWAVLLGLGNGGTFPLALTLVTLRTRTPETTQGVWAMAQTVGYLLAAAGPLALGLLHDITGAWAAGLALLVALVAVQGVAGLGAGRAVYVGDAWPSKA